MCLRGSRTPRAPTSAPHSVLGRRFRHGARGEIPTATWNSRRLQASECGARARRRRTPPRENCDHGALATLLLAGHPVRGHGSGDRKGSGGEVHVLPLEGCDLTHVKAGAGLEVELTQPRHGAVAVTPAFPRSASRWRERTSSAALEAGRRMRFFGSYSRPFRSTGLSAMAPTCHCEGQEERMRSRRTCAMPMVAGVLALAGRTPGGRTRTRGRLGISADCAPAGLPGEAPGGWVLMTPQLQFGTS